MESQFEHKIISNAIIAMSIAISMRDYEKAEIGAREILVSIQRIRKNETKGTTEIGNQRRSNPVVSG